MGLSRNTINRLQEDLIRLEEIKEALSSYVPPGKRDALLRRKVMLESAIRQRTNHLKSLINKKPVEAIILADLDEGVKKYRRVFYGLTLEEAKELIDIEMHYKKIFYTLVKLEHIDTSSKWEELLESK